MACGSKIRSMRSISCTWYCTVSRSSKHQVAFGPTASWRSPLCRITRVRNAGRSRAYCSSGMRSLAASLSMSASCGASDAIRDPQQPQRMLGCTRLREAARDLLPRHGAVAGVMIGLRALDPLHHRAPDPDRSGAKLALHTVGAVMPRAALDGVEAGAWHEPHEIARLEPDVLHPQVTGDVVAHLAERYLEVGAQQPRLVAQHEIFERVERARGDLAHLRILGVHERQLLLEHEHARGDRRHQVVAGVDGLRQLRDVVLLEPRDRLQVAELEPRHATTALLRHQRDFDAVVREHRHQVLSERRLDLVAPIPSCVLMFK